MYDNITINAHSSIRVEGSKVIYFDPYEVKQETHDADIIFITHDHHDHYSPEDSAKVAKADTLFVIPASCDGTINEKKKTTIAPGETKEIEGLKVEAVRAYNPNKQFHTKDKDFVGYVVTMDGTSYYVCGDMDATPEGLAVKSDVTLIPSGGKYTFNVEEAVDFIKKQKPAKCAIPTHYGCIIGEAGDGDKFVELLKGSVYAETKIKF